MDKVFIYTLMCPLTGEVRYVGKANDPFARLRSHMRDSKQGQRPVCTWIRKLARENLMLKMVVIEEVTADTWEQAERDAIARHRAAGCRLLNVADGGARPHCTPEQRAAMMDARQNDPLKRRVWFLKKQLSAHMKWLKDTGRTESYERMAAKLRYAAAKCPSKFGSWANL